MKVRNILIGLLVVLMAFVFISCEDEPEPQPQPVKVDDTVYKLTATKGISDAVFSHDKFSIWFKEAVEPGATISMEFRSTADYFQMNVRGIGGSPKYVYEEDIKTDGSNSFKLEPLSDGWTKFSYTFADDAADNEDFRVDFRGWIIPGDVMELRHVFYDGQQIALSEENMSGTDYAAPTLEAIADHEWTTPKTYKVAYFIGKPSDVDKNPIVETVAAGGTVTKAALVKENSEIAHIYNYDKSGTQGAEFDASTAINADTFLLVVWKGVDRTVTFNLNYEGAEDLAPAIVENGNLVEDPEPTWAGHKLLGWTYAADDDELENEYDFATPVTADLVLYAQWASAVDVTLHANYEGADPATQVVQAALAAAMEEPEGFEREGWFFDKWTLDAAGTQDYDFANTLVDAEFELYAQWIQGRLITLNYLDKAVDPTTKSFYVRTGAKMDEPKGYAKAGGYYFDAWYTENTCENEFDFANTTIAVGDTLNLYAGYTESTSYTLMTATKGINEGWYSYDKYRIQFGDGSAAIVEKGDVLSITFRSTRTISDYSIRNDDYKWIYEQPRKKALPEGFVTVGENGWITISFTFGEKTWDNGSTINYETKAKKVYFDFIGHIIKDDFLEIKSISKNGVPFAATVLTGKYVKPSSSSISAGDSVWDGAVTNVVFFYADPTQGGGTNYSGGEEGDADLTGSAVAVANGGLIIAPANPERDGFTFGGWSTSKDGSALWNFAEDTVSAETKLYAVWTPAEP